MATEFSIDARTGCIGLGDHVRLEARQSKAATAQQVAPWSAGSRNLGNGYEWLHLRGLTFGGQSASLSLCFHDDRLEEVAWSIQLPNAWIEGGWPTRQAIDEEVAFVRGILARQLGFDPAREWMTLRWGEVWSDFDPKGCFASHGLRYRRS